MLRRASRRRRPDRRKVAGRPCRRWRVGPAANLPREGGGGEQHGLDARRGSLQVACHRGKNSHCPWEMVTLEDAGARIVPPVRLRMATMCRFRTGPGVRRHERPVRCPDREGAAVVGARSGTAQAPASRSAPRVRSGEGGRRRSPTFAARRDGGCRGRRVAHVVEVMTPGARRESGGRGRDARSRARLTPSTGPMPRGRTSAAAPAER